MLKNRFLGLFLTVGFVTISSLPAHAGLEFLHPAALWERIQHEVAKQDIGATVPLVDANILEGLSTSLSYRIQSEPSYVDGYYTRLDRYKMQFNLNPGDFIDALDTPVGININKGTEIIFARQFKSQKDSVLALPYTPRNLPFTAKNAIERLAPGDFVAFEGRLSFVLSLGKDFLKGDFVAGANTHAFMSGTFLVHLFRMANNKMRVKLIAVRGKGVGASAGVDLAHDIDLVGFNIVDNALERWISLTPLNTGTGLGKNDVIMLDYVFNLNDAEAAKAYDSLMLYKVQLKDVKVFNPAATTKDLTQELLTDLTDVEKISLEDSHRAPQDRRVDRIFKGSAEGINKDARIKFGLNLWKFETGKAYGENKVLSYDKQDQEQYFLLDTLSRYKKTKILFGLFGEETLFTSNLLFLADNSWNPVRFVTLTSSAEMKMKDVSNKDVREIKRLVKDTLGESQYNQINWGAWSDNTETKINGYFKQEVFFNPEALNALPRLSPEALSARFKQYIEIKGRPRSRPFFGGNSPKDYLMPWIYSFTGDIRRVGVYLAIIVNPETTIQERFNAFESLQQIPIWKERGIGFLMSFIPDSARPQYLRYELVLSAKGIAPVQYRFGSFVEEKLYRSLMYIQNIINNRSFDLRLYSDNNGEWSASATPAPLR